MNEISTITNILQGHIPTNSEITVCGWVKTRRDSRKLSFLNIYDGSCLHTLQVIVENKKIHNYKKDILHLTSGCSVKIIGKIVQSIGKKQNIELQAKHVEILGLIENPDTYPISPKKHNMEYLREIAHLRPRTNIIGAISRTRNVLAHAIHNFMNKNGFLWIPTPIITTTDTEGTSKMFQVSTLNFKNLPYTPSGNINYAKDFFGKESFLTVSGQLNVESYACALSKTYTFGPTFRAEPSNTNKHLAEFWMIEPEVAFADLDNIICIAKSLLQHICKTILKKCSDDIDFFSKKHNLAIINRLENIVEKNFIEITYTQAINILKQSKKQFKNKIFWGANLLSEHEKYLTEEYFNQPTIIKHYPKKIKAFYMRLNDDMKTSAAMDILLPGIGEIIGGSQREERLNVLDKNLEEFGLNKNNYQWYRDLRRYGTVPHSGFGLGFERLMLFITGIKNIRDIVPFPRTLKNINY
ncbi:asparagine--tRNA ligase [Blochmannia endosymbiont of Polyrhachis (Hedomyrma) turneri]|uniref:asparagine--tRNA ligase n=1 Tax=Blochmannia endosymbiont of Polyrhachis (Hedomyrma) turneri TaxID=1505596 RepID=UPI00061A895D|nr:asparagine--tRNA ligase [Blochmannia endosymbiont of Polyrhachis (Hedomyrma) turneri]AKC59982.1 Asparagine--tRNA ligase [Blochmannia endosymbiont of Polyrhachis (Hedomyrma) turneri]